LAGGGGAARGEHRRAYPSIPPHESAEAGYYILPHVILWPGRTYPEEKAAWAKAAEMNTKLGDKEVRVGGGMVGEMLGFEVRPNSGWIVENQWPRQG